MVEGCITETSDHPNLINFQGLSYTDEEKKIENI